MPSVRRARPLPSVWPPLALASVWPALPVPTVGLPPVEFGSELVAAAFPAFGDLLDGVAHGLEPVQLSRAGAPGGGRAALAGPGP